MIYLGSISLKCLSSGSNYSQRKNFVEEQAYQRIHKIMVETAATGGLRLSKSNP